MAGNDQPDWTGVSVSHPAQQSYAATISESAQLPPDFFEEVTFLAPAGSFVTLAAVQFAAAGPAGATTGTTFAEMHLNTPGGQTLGLIDGSSKLADQLEYDYGYWQFASDAQQPNTPNAPTWWSGHVGMDATRGVTFLYQNSTNATMTFGRLYQVAGIQTVFQA